MSTAAFSRAASCLMAVSLDMSLHCTYQIVSCLSLLACLSFQGAATKESILKAVKADGAKAQFVCMYV